MSVVILGGLDRLKPSYLKKGKAMGFDVRVFSQRVPKLGQRVSQVDGIIIFTGTVSHHMMEEANQVAKRNNIPVGRSRNSSVSGLKRCLEEFSSREVAC